MVDVEVGWHVERVRSTLGEPTRDLNAPLEASDLPFDPRFSGPRDRIRRVFHYIRRPQKSIVVFLDSRDIVVFVEKRIDAMLVTEEPADPAVPLR